MTKITKIRNKKKTLRILDIYVFDQKKLLTQEIIDKEHSGSL